MFELRIRIQPDKPVSDLTIAQEVIGKDCYNVRSLVGAGGTVVDVGAHIGTFSLLVASLDPAAEVLAFEPEPSNFSLLVQNCAANPALQIRPYNLAVTPYLTRTAVLSVNNDNTGGHSVGAKGGTLRVRTIALSEVFALTRNDRIDVLKLDCEGCEFGLLGGLRSEELSRIGTIVAEVHLGFLPDARLLDLLALLDREGFRCSIIDEAFWADEGLLLIIKATR